MVFFGSSNSINFSLYLVEFLDKKSFIVALLMTWPFNLLILIDSRLLYGSIEYKRSREDCHFEH